MYLPLTPNDILPDFLPLLQLPTTHGGKRMENTASE
jgi:hypothetical protein